MVRLSIACIAAPILAAAATAGHAQQAIPLQPAAVLFENVRVFDGKSDRLAAPANVLVVGNTIRRILVDPIALPAESSIPGIDGGGRAATDMLLRGLHLGARPGWPSARPQKGLPNPAKQRQMISGTDTAYGLARQYGLKTAFGTDTLFDAKLATRQGAQLAKLVRWYTPAEVLRMAASTNAELLALAGPRNPYPGRLGVVEEGALADLLLVNGDPLANIRLIEDPARNFAVIMKDGRLYKNTLQ